MSSEDSWAQITEAHNKDQWASLLEACALHLKKNPNHIQAQIPQAIALRHLKRFDEAVALLQKTYTDPSASEQCKYQCQTQLGETLQEVGRFDDARRAYDEAYRLLPKNTVAIIYRGVMELRVGKFSEARQWFNRALKCSEGDVDEAHFNIGSTYLCERNYEKAIEHYQVAITLDPNYDIAWERLADAKRAREIRQQSN